MPTPDASLAFNSGLSDLIVADPLTDGNQIRIRGTSNLHVSWEINNAGTLSCQVPVRDLRTIDVWLDPKVLKHRWVHYSHPTAGPWGGVITLIDVDDGIVTINAESWAALLREAITTGYGASMSKGINLWHDIDYNAPATGITVNNLSDNPSITPEPDFFEAGRSIYDEYLPAVLERWHAERGWQNAGLQQAGWNVDPVTRQFYFDTTYGIDKSATVVLADAYHNVSSGWTDDLQDVVNWVRMSAQVNIQYSVAVPTQDRHGSRSTITMFNATASAVVVGINPISIDQYGLRPMNISDDAIFPSLAALQSAADNRATVFSRNTQKATLTCADVNAVFRDFREGDVVTAWLSNNNVRGRMFIQSRALDVGRGTMTVSGEADFTAGF
jgi:hypothetical protein